MRPIIAFNRVSADGYFASHDGKLDWVVPDEELDKSAGKAIGEGGGSGTLLFGRKTYEMFQSFWPNALREAEKRGAATAQNPHAANQSPEMLAMAKYINAAQKIVWSRTLNDVTWENTRLIREFDPHDVQELKRGPGNAMMIFGSGEIASRLSEYRLIDEYHFIVNPVILGDGKTLISDADSAKLELLESKAYPSGCVMLRFALARS